MSTRRTVPDIGLDFLLERCTQCPDNGCLLWKGKMKDHQPTFTLAAKQWKVRRVVWAMVNIHEARKSWVVGTTCEDDRCCHPDHLAQRKRNHHHIGTHRPISHRIRSAQAQRARGKLTLEAVTAIRSASGTLKEIAADFGVSIAWASRIRSQQVWRDYSSPFSQLVR